MPNKGRVRPTKGYIDATHATQHQFMCVIDGENLEIVVAKGEEEGISSGGGLWLYHKREKRNLSTGEGGRM